MTQEQAGVNPAGLVHPVPQDRIASTLQFDSWAEVCSHFRKTSTTSHLYRGQRRPEWGLVTGLDRVAQELIGRWGRAPRASSGHNLRAFLWSRAISTFRQYAAGSRDLDFSRVSEKSAEFAVIARHYGLETPLLDWTRSPYVAAFFALADFAEKGPFESEHACVWMLRIEHPLSGESEVKGIDLVAPVSDQLHRQRAQQSVYTHFMNPKFLDLESYLDSIGDLGRLERVLIPLGSEALIALHDLNGMNVRFATLFPDLDGAAKEASLEIRPWVERLSSHPTGEQLLLRSVVEPVAPHPDGATNPGRAPSAPGDRDRLPR